jgi:sugar lactone lactonase YvrE
MVSARLNGGKSFAKAGREVFSFDCRTSLRRGLGRVSIVFGSVLVALGCPVAQGQTQYEPYSFTTFAGKAGVSGSADGTGSAARFSSPSQIAIDQDDNLFLADTANHTIRKITPAGVVTTVAGLAGSSGSADGTGSNARFNSPIGVAVDAAGNLFIGDSDNSTIRKITPGGVVTTFAGMAGMTGSTDGVGAAARFNGPRGLAIDANGNIYVCDTFNNTIRKITPSATVTTLAGMAGVFGSADGTGSAARFNRPRSIAFGTGSNLFVTDTANDLIRRVTTAGVVTTTAGAAEMSGSTDGTVFAARFFGPIGLGVSDDGSIFISDTVNDTIRKISSTGVVTTLGGVPLTSGSADGVGMNARFSSPQSAALDSANRLFVSDTGNNTIRMGVPVTPTPTPTPTPSPSVTPTPTPPPTRSQALNISTRVQVGAAEKVMIGGFVISGTTPKPVLIRAIGPSLSQFGLTGLPDPVLELHASNGTTILTNDDWQDDPTQAALIEATNNAPQNDLESAMVVNLAAGSYTAIVSGKNGATGTGLVEVYDEDESVDSSLANISTRGFVQTGNDVMIGGFILGHGDQGLQVLVRAIGPSLTQFGITDALADPTLEVRNANGDLIGSNDNWKSNPNEADIEATNLAPGDDAESAVLQELPAGSYTVIVAGKNGGTGVGLVEVYSIQ